MKNLTKKLFLSMLTVAFAVVALGTTTFAWFTLSTEARVEAFDAKVTGGSGFEIAVTPKDGDASASNVKWYSGSLPSSEIAAVLDDNFKFDALHLNANTPNSPLTFTSLKLENQAFTTPEAKKGFATFDLHFKLTDSSVKTWKIELEKYTFSANFTEEEKKGKTADAAYKIGLGTDISLNDQVLYNVAHSARLGILHETKNLIYQAPSSNNNLDVTPKKIGNTVVQSGEYGAYAYFSAKNNFSDSANTAAETAFANAFKDRLNKDEALTEVAAHTEVADFNQTDGMVKIHVYVWLDGWDNECMNPIFNQTLQTSLSFRLVSTAKKE